MIDQYGNFHLTDTDTDMLIITDAGTDTDTDKRKTNSPIPIRRNGIHLTGAATNPWIRFESDDSFIKYVIGTN